MTANGLMALQVIGGFVFLIMSVVYTFKVALNDNLWLLGLFTVAIMAYLVSFFYDLGFWYGWISGASIFIVFAITWVMILYHITRITVIIIVEFRRTILIMFSVIALTSTVIYFTITYGLYREFFLTLLGITLISAFIGKPLIIRTIVLSLTKVSLAIVTISVSIYALGAFVHMSYNYGFNIFFEFGSEQFWLAWAEYVYFTRLAFSFVLVNTIILLFIPPLNIAGFLGILISAFFPKQFGDKTDIENELYASARIRYETGYW